VKAGAIIAANGADRQGNSSGNAARPGRRLLVPLLSGAAAATLALGFVVYALWPRWPDAPPAGEVPHLPIVVAGVTFQVPPAAIRMKVQRHPGAQERVDLAFAWPDLAPFAQASDGGNGGVAPAAERLFVSIAGSDGVAEPAERLRSIYLRYVASERSPAPEGLIMVAFRSGTPYEGEDLVYDEDAPQRFIARCARSKQALTPASCLMERFIGPANVTVRFPRDWLSDWRSLVNGLDRLIADLRPETGG
jgi:hypothetical protein